MVILIGENGYFGGNGHKLAQSIRLYSHAILRGFLVIQNSSWTSTYERLWTLYFWAH